jgi:hypothetical protein
MYEPGMTARKVAVFNPAIFDKAKALLDQYPWTDKHKRKGDDTYLLYLPNSPERIAGFYDITGPITKPMVDIMCAFRQPINYLMRLTGITDPVLVQADIARMEPGGDTQMHTDTRYTQRYSRRYNIAIDTNPDCYLYHISYDLDNGGVRDHIEPGELWELNNKIEHTAVNYGTTWRTHLIIDVMPRNYYERMWEKFPNAFGKVPNLQGKNNTYDLDKDGNMLNYWTLFNDLPHCFPARTHV